MTDLDLRALLMDVADRFVPEPDPLDDLHELRRRIGRRRAVHRVQAGAGAVVGVAAIGSAAMLAAPPAPVPAAPVTALCGTSISEAALGPAELTVSGELSLAPGDGGSVLVETTLRNDGPTAFTTPTEGVDVLVSLPGTGRIVATGSGAPSRPVTLAPGEAQRVSTEVHLLACEGTPLADGTYNLTMLSDATDDGGAPAGWQLAATSLLSVEDGAPTLAEPSPAGAAFSPVCGAMIPAVPENPVWATVAGTGPGPFRSADPGAAGVGGMSLDLTVGTTSSTAIVGTLSGDVVAVLTDLDGQVVTWWRASEHGVTEPAATAVTLPPSGSVILPGAGWFPVADACRQAPIANGEYHLFAWLVLGTDTGTDFPVLTAPLRVHVTDGSLLAD